MNFYNLNLKDESLVKKNAANFYLMEAYASQFCEIDKLRKKNFQEFSKISDQKQANTNNSTHKTTHRIMSIGFTCFLIYKTKSILVAPLFLSNYFLLKRFMQAKPEECFFCCKNKVTYENKRIYNEYYKVINEVFTRNPNIKSLDEFELELDDLLKTL